MFIPYTHQTQQNRHRRIPPRTPVPSSGSSSAPALPPLRPTGRDYGRNDPFLPAWFSEEAQHSPPRRVNPDSKAKLTEEVDFLRENHFLPAKNYGDLLTQAARLAEANESARYVKELERYQELSGFQQLFTAKPHINGTLTMLTFDFSQLEAKYHDRGDQATVFCAMSELHDRGFVRMRGKYPYIVSITPLGKEVLERLEAEPPVYRQLDKPPEYDFDTQA